MSLKHFIQCTKLLLERGLYESRRAVSTEPGAQRGMDVTPLEQRILMSATPAAVAEVAPAADASTTIDQSLLDVVGETLLPPSSDHSDTNADATDSAAADTRTLELVFIDASVSNLEQMIADLTASSDRDASRDIQVIEIDPHADGLAQITSAVLQFDNVDGIHIVSHGDSGAVVLGNATLSLDTIDTYESAISGWRHSMSDEADLLFYGCNLAESSDGRELLGRIAATCDCDVAASEDLTGHESLGGDWDLEYSTGTIDAASAFSDTFEHNWYQVLATLQLNPT